MVHPPLDRQLRIWKVKFFSIRFQLQCGRSDGRCEWACMLVCGSGSKASKHKKGFQQSKLFLIECFSMQTMNEYPSSCGRCFELKCRPAEINSADGQVKRLNQTKACLDENKSIVIQVVDTCPCSDNKAWCCGDTPHFDLGEHTFKKVSKIHCPAEGAQQLSRCLPCFRIDWQKGLKLITKKFGLMQLANNSQGVIGLSWRAVPCSAKNGTVTEDDTKKLEDALGKPVLSLHAHHLLVPNNKYYCASSIN